MFIRGFNQMHKRENSAIKNNRKRKYLEAQVHKI